MRTQNFTALIYFGRKAVYKTIEARKKKKKKKQFQTSHFTDLFHITYRYFVAKVAEVSNYDVWENV
jgi:hypothetical protein